MSSPFEVFGSQNKDDDDGQVIDSFFIETDSPPPLKDATQPIDPTPDDKPIAPTRMLTGWRIIDSSWTEPFMLLAADTRRQQFHMDVIFTGAGDATFNDYVIVADEKAKCQLPADGSTLNSGDAMHIYATAFKSGNASGVSLDVHTGAIWVRVNPSISSALKLTWVSTTK